MKNLKNYMNLHPCEKNTCYLMYINMLHLVIIHESKYITFMKLSIHFTEKCMALIIKKKKKFG